MKTGMTPLDWTIITGYLTVRGVLDQSLVAGRTASVIIATAMGLALVINLERETRGEVRWWVWSMVGGFALIFTVGLLMEPLRAFFEVVMPTPRTWCAIAVVCGVGVAMLAMARRISARRPAMPTPSGQLT